MSLFHLEWRYFFLSQDIELNVVASVLWQFAFLRLCKRKKREKAGKKQVKKPRCLVWKSWVLFGWLGDTEKWKKLQKARKSEKVSKRIIVKLFTEICRIWDQARDFAGLQKLKTKARSLSKIDKSPSMSLSLFSEHTPQISNNSCQRASGTPFFPWNPS